jgi:hypothetical protein
MTSIFKHFHCEQNLIQFISSIPFDSIISSDIHNDSFLSYLPKSTPFPTIFFTNYVDKIYSFVFSDKSICIKSLSFTCFDIDKTNYINNLILDSNRNWILLKTIYSPQLSFSSSSNNLSNQMLTLLRICKINSNDYIQNPDILANKFKK